jgi:hypothetical protein
MGSNPASHWCLVGHLLLSITGEHQPRSRMNNKPKFSNEAGASDVNFTQPSRSTIHLAWSEAASLEVQVAADEEIERRYHVAIEDVTVESRAVAELGARAMFIGLLVEDAADPSGAESLLPV